VESGEQRRSEQGGGSEIEIGYSRQPPPNFSWIFTGLIAAICILFVPSHDACFLIDFVHHSIYCLDWPRSGPRTSQTGFKPEPDRWFGVQSSKSIEPEPYKEVWVQRPTEPGPKVPNLEPRVSRLKH